MALKALTCRKSRRQKAGKRYKIIKKIAASKRKKEKEARKLPRLKSKKQKLIQIPNVCPFKEEILQDVAKEKLRQEEEKLKEKELRKKTSLESMVVDAEKKLAEHKPEEDQALKEPEYNQPKGKEGSLRAYFKEFKKVIDAADVVLEVVDARDPLGTRCQEVAQIVREATGQKRLVVIVNKADLVPRENLEKWLKYLRKFGPVVPFKATTQTQKFKIGNKKFHKTKVLEQSACIGADLLKELLANYCRSDDMRTSVRVGIVGLPNVGKSSIINSLKRKRACLVGARPGITKVMQEVQIDSHVKLIDSPGIIFQKPKSEDSHKFYGLKNAQVVSEIQDPFGLAEDILKRGTMQYFCKLYDISEFHSPEEFLAKKAIKMGRLAKGGVPDLKKAARSLIEDWNIGKIKYCTHPPEEEADAHVSAEIVTSNVPEFNIENFDSVLQKLDSEYEQSFKMKDEDGEEYGNVKKEDIITMEVDVKGPVSMQLSKEDEQNNALAALIRSRGQIIEDDEVEMPDTGKAKKRKFNDYAEEEKKYRTDPVFKIEGNQTVNKNRKAELKKKAKLSTRNEKKVKNVADVLESFSLGETTGEKKENSDNYDFDNDFIM